MIGGCTNLLQSRDALLLDCVQGVCWAAANIETILNQGRGVGDDEKIGLHPPHIPLAGRPTCNEAPERVLRSAWRKKGSPSLSDMRRRHSDSSSRVAVTLAVESADCMARSCS